MALSVAVALPLLSFSFLFPAARTGPSSEISDKR